MMRVFVWCIRTRASTSCSVADCRRVGVFGAVSVAMVLTSSPCERRRGGPKPAPPLVRRAPVLLLLAGAGVRALRPPGQVVHVLADLLLGRDVLPPEVVELGAVRAHVYVLDEVHARQVLRDDLLDLEVDLLALFLVERLAAQLEELVDARV